jgi:putative transposase
VIDILMQSRRDRRAATRFFRKLLKHQGSVPRRLITDKLRSYAAARRAVMPSVVHVNARFKSAAQVQRFASVHGLVQNLFRVGRHLLRSAHHRLLRGEAFRVWDAVTFAC